MGWLFDLTPHQLDVLRTLASIAGGAGGFLSGAAVVYARLAAKRSKQAVHQTASTEWVDGHLVYVAAPDVKASKRHRFPTQEIERIPSE